MDNRCILQSRLTQLDVWALHTAGRGHNRKQRHSLVEVRVEGREDL